MSLLSTLRPLPQRLLERLWLILSGYMPTSIEYQMTMNALNDDCLLILLDTLTMSQLLQLRGVSRRLCHLIEGHSLRQFRTLIFEEISLNKEKKTSNELVCDECTIQLHFATRMDAYKEFRLSKDFYLYSNEDMFPASMLVPLRSNAWPLSLPHLLPRLSCLTLEYFLVDQVEASTEMQLALNRLLVPYLNSNWSTTLTTLHLHLIMPSQPQPDNASFAQLNQLINLKHLFIQFSKLHEPELLEPELLEHELLEPEDSSFLLPDSMPIFGQLLSFGLRCYDGSNTATLLHQLGPDLSFLSLYNVNCSEDDCITFLRARPNYARTLKTFDVSLEKMKWELFTVATQNLSSLELFGYTLRDKPKTELDSILTDLSHLPHLQYISWVLLSVEQLRALSLRQHMPGALPRLTNIHRADIILIPHGYEEWDPIQPNELFDHLLPLLPKIFCSLEKLTILISPSGCKDEALSEQLSTKVRQLFPGLEYLRAIYKVE